MELKNRLPRKVQIDITPLIDVVFLLLIFLMVSSTFIEQPGIKIALPSATTAKSERVEDLVIMIADDGKIYLNKKLLDRSKLAEELKQAVADSPQKAVILKADRKVSHGDVVTVMDLARKSGIKRLVVGTRPGWTGPSPVPNN
jgi:biopolymer transport protein ExbD